MLNKSDQHLYYLNALFDLNLGGYTTGKNSRSASEMSLLFGYMGDENDRVLLDVDMPEDFLYYLQSVNVKPLDLAAKGGTLYPVPWGWDSHAFDKFKNIGLKCDNPDLSIVKEVNSRRFHNTISGKYGLGVTGSSYCESAEDYLKILKKFDSGEMVVKPSFGGSGFGFRFIKEREQGKDFREIETLMQHGGVVIEPWCKRVYDFSSSIIIHNDGSLSSIRHQRSFSNSYGAFIGIYLAPDDPVIEKYKSVQESAVRNTAQALFARGYFGPAGFDSFIYTDHDGKENIAPVVEINARHSMSDVAHAIRNRYAPQKWCFFRLMSKRRCRLPGDYKLWKDLINGDHFDPDTQEGVILLTPLRLKLGNSLIQPLRNGFFISAGSERELFERDRRLRRVLEDNLSKSY